MAEFGVYQPGMAALSVRTQQRSFSHLNAFSGSGSGGVDVVGLAVVIGAIVLVAHLARRKK
jgi:hypothetical protein